MLASPSPDSQSFSEHAAYVRLRRRELLEMTNAQLDGLDRELEQHPELERRVQETTAPLLDQIKSLQESLAANLSAREAQARRLDSLARQLANHQVQGQLLAESLHELAQAPEGQLKVIVVDSQPSLASAAPKSAAPMRRVMHASVPGQLRSFSDLRGAGQATLQKVTPVQYAPTAAAAEATAVIAPVKTRRRWFGGKKKGAEPLATPISTKASSTPKPAPMPAPEPVAKAVRPVNPRRKPLRVITRGFAFAVVAACAFGGYRLLSAQGTPETGAVAVVAYTVSDDVGTVINPLLVEGQVHGGVAQGLGQAVLERTSYDPTSGQLLSGSFMDYTMPRADDLPDIEVEFIEVPCASNPLGVKGAGEAGAVGSPPAVINAIIDALSPMGITHIDMPATPEVVWKALELAKAA